MGAILWKTIKSKRRADLQHFTNYFVRTISL